MTRIRLGTLGIVVLGMLWAGPLAGCGDDSGLDNNNTGNDNNNNNETPPECGNGVVEAGEACDGSDLDGETCTGLGYDGGALGCASDCTLDESGCTMDPTCGDGSVDAGEACDDGNNDSGDGCSADCQSDETCGNGYVDNAAGEACDDGNNDPGDGCGPTCLLEACGNGVVDPGEVCDDDNNDSGDGCSADCQSDETCGNGYVDNAVGEACDDGNTIAGDGCSPSCELESCGNNHLDAGEVCDDGNNVDGDGCSADCQSNEVCGNGVVDAIRNELCDDGNNTSGDGCSADCMSNETCGNGIVDVVNGELCDDGNVTAGDGCGATCQPEYCGNNLLDPGEVCDDGGNVNGDGCSADCLSNETCGNSIVDVAVGEGCDDGNSTAGDGCSATCQVEICGNGVLDPGEVCDDGDNTGGDGCSADCLSDETCGNNIVDVAAGESCDDGNTAGGDGCSAICVLEDCGNGVLDPGELCDDSNNISGDGCSADCLSDETCGNSYIDGVAGEQCDDGNVTAGDGCGPTCQLEICGNGVMDPGEVCDDNNTASGDGCSADCLSDETCGNGYLDTATGEVCDDGNVADGDGCAANCFSDETCGNGVVDAVNGEVCDDGNVADGDGCAANCLSDETCGNGVLDAAAGEVCDDGNTDNGDGCTSACAEEGCAEAVDVSSVAFPHQRTGDFTADPADGGSCEPTPNNAVFFTYTAPSTGWFTIDLVNQTTAISYSRVAVFTTTACSPYGAEIACETANARDITVSMELTAGQAYLIMFYTDGDTWPMEDPEISITPIMLGPGDECAQAIDVTSAALPHTEAGAFDAEVSPGGTCDTTPNNMVFFRYTASATGWYRVVTTNTAGVAGSTRQAIFETAACSPYGAQLACDLSTTASAENLVQMTAGQTYLIAFYTGAETTTMVNPQVDIIPYSPAPGEVCTDAIDVSGVAFPHLVVGDFSVDPTAGGSCDTTPNNAVFFSYTPTATGWYQIDLDNATTTIAYSRLAIFQTTACSPYGAEEACLTSTTTTIGANVELFAGQSYLILFYTDGESYTMIDPTITIGPGTAPPPGDSCTNPADTGAANHYVGGGGEDCWSWTASVSNTVNDHIFSCDPAVGGDVVATITTGPTQTTLDFDATISAFETNGYIRVEISDAPCASGASLYCTASSSLTTDFGAVTVTPSTTYYVWVADGYASHHLPDVDLCLW